MADDPYDVLGLPRGASPQQVTEAYRALAQIYHPDRYAESPSRVKEEALRRMQAVNTAYDALRSTSPRPPPRASQPPSSSAAPPPPPPRRTTTRQRSRTTAMAAVLYVDGSRRYHAADVAPLGLDLHADPVRTAPSGRQCRALDEELGRWFQNQSRSASMTDKLLFASWDEQQRALYTATVGCSEVLQSSVEQFASACPECRPASG